MDSLLQRSPDMLEEYSCEVVRIGELTPLEGSDFLAKTEIHPGMPIVVRKDMVHPGDIMFYVDIECQLNHGFLSVNNQFQEPLMNADPNCKGFFDKSCRVKMIRLRGQESMGYLFSYDALRTYKPRIELDMDNLVGTVFDTVDGELFVKAYIPTHTRKSSHKKSDNKHVKRIERFDRMIPGVFVFHYETSQLEKNIQQFNPDDVVDISVKVHGTSAIFSHCKVRRKVSWWEKLLSLFGYPVDKYEYDLIYSSRKVIKNQYINPGASHSYYDTNVWEYWANLIRKYIPQNFTIYGEIVGYTPSGSCIQRLGNVYDYGCQPGESKLMIYRLTERTDDGVKEYDISDVCKFTEDIIGRMMMNGDDATANRIMPLPVLYHGTLKNLYPNIPISDHWAADVLHALAKDADFYMEKSEPLCINDVPREGIVIRKENDSVKEAFKLKTFAFRNKEAKSVDKGYVDMEMSQSDI